MTDESVALIFKRNEFPGSRIQDDLVLFNQEAGSYYATGSVGAEIWDFLETPRSFDEICAHLLERFEVDEITCRKEVRSFLADMDKASLVSAQPR